MRTNGLFKEGRTGLIHRLSPQILVEEFYPVKTCDWKPVLQIWVLQDIPVWVKCTPCIPNSLPFFCFGHQVLNFRLDKITKIHQVVNIRLQKENVASISWKTELKVTKYSAITSTTENLPLDTKNPMKWIHHQEARHASFPELLNGEMEF